MSDFPLNSMIASNGRIVERLNLLSRIKIRQCSWEAMFSRKYSKRLEQLEEKLIRHNKIMFNRKYPDCPRMAYVQINGGWIFMPYKWAEKIMTLNFILEDEFGFNYSKTIDCTIGGDL